ncbi:MAG: hypothetical protein WBC04_22545 [Candidatus Acidiferrales bacterium]|jgi:hypothetical protein
MKIRTTTILLVSGFLSVAYLASPGLLRGQAPAGPMAPTEPKAPPPSAQTRDQQPQQPQGKQSLSGSWKLNRDQSDDAHKKMQEARGGNGAGGRGGQGGGGRVGGNWPFPGGGGQGPYGGRRGGAGGEQGDEDRKQMQELFDPAESLAIAQKDAEVDLTDDQSRKRVFYTDGRKLQKSKDDKYRELAARWDGSRLVSEQNGSRGGKITRSFELAPEGQQLYETMRLDNSRSGSPVVIRYVYDVVREAKQ